LRRTAAGSIVSSTDSKPYPEDERLYGIAEVSRITGLKQFVLRYWESEFPMLDPAKSHNKHRMYRQQDVDLVLAIKRLLYDEGFTIAGARRHLEEIGVEANGHAAESEQQHAGPEQQPSKPEHIESAAPQQAAPVRAQTPATQPPSNGKTANMSRETLLELRDALRGFLTLLERK
jgi:DNA-binding transcriptional MerR regulator